MVLHRLLNWREVKHLVIRTHRIIGAPIVTIDHHLQLGKLLSPLTLIMYFFLINFLCFFHCFLVKESLSWILNRLHLSWNADATHHFDVASIVAVPARILAQVIC